MTNSFITGFPFYGNDVFYFVILANASIQSMKLVYWMLACASMTVKQFQFNNAFLPRTV
jgi:hypothetical protein